MPSDTGHKALCPVSLLQLLLQLQFQFITSTLVASSPEKPCSDHEEVHEALLKILGEGRRGKYDGRQCRLATMVADHRGEIDTEEFVDAMMIALKSTADANKNNERRCAPKRCQ